ncbi:nucleotidyltransferase domain-containing protein [Pseudenhygromyxa sp. WMMC2535]|uniref:DNA polymerase beta superfamily protein n=1 Tax=Pseudenhygromyxa sp. WMMC2535 TaxID=2712867 RepID=UPI00155488FF|nr:nucleotidyltransferase domain-containing protein [Pseudenhygromyxa sp. WMMC2535]NVB43346.1 nucleotidyltransferase domain-containing protein [Pseudenhygromyxa sp. WMMC2535]
MSFDVDAHTHFLGLTGSHAYGTARRGSDVDLRGCCVAPLATRLSFRAHFEQLSWTPASPDEPSPLGANYRAALDRARTHPSAGPCLADDPLPDVVIFDLAKVVNLCAQNNPNMLELLFLDEREVLLCTPLWSRLRAERARFLSQKVRHTYAGYAHGQLKRIERHREWLLHPPERPPTRADFGLPEQSVLSADERNRVEEGIAKLVRSWSVDEGIELPSAERDVLRERLREFWSATIAATRAGEASLDRAQVQDEHALDEEVAAVAGAALGLSRQLLAILRQERRYRSARQRWNQFQRWQRERNPKRAALEAQHGYDTKHGMHLIRLLRMGLEILRDGEVRVHRDDASELLEIRAGALSYDDLLAEAKRLDLAMREALPTSPLPKTPDEAALDELLIELLREAG